MNGDVKGRRTAVTVAPQARTRRTQAAVVAAARRLFLERGYAATTIEAISELSDTPQPTVYRLFSSKLGILKAVLDVSIAGDDEAVAMADRPQVRSLVANPDPRDTLTGFAALVGGLMARTAPVHRVLEEAARSDQGAAAALAEIARQRHDGQRRITRSLIRAGALRPGLKEREAADIVHALASPEVYRLLVTDRGWSGERYRQWLSSILIDQLLPGRGGEGNAAKLRRSPDQLARARLRHYGGGQLAVAYLYGELRDLGYLERCSARGPGLGRIPIAEVRE
jgi:AcrR family transcriptional regulator